MIQNGLNTLKLLFLLFHLLLPCHFQLAYSERTVSVFLFNPTSVLPKFFYNCYTNIIAQYGNGVLEFKRMMILNLRNANKLRTTVFKNNNKILLFAHDFEFVINYNLMKNLDREVNLMANIFDYRKTLCPVPL